MSSPYSYLDCLNESPISMTPLPMNNFWSSMISPKSQGPVSYSHDWRSSSTSPIPMALDLEQPFQPFSIKPKTNSINSGLRMYNESSIVPAESDTYKPSTSRVLELESTVASLNEANKKLSQEVDSWKAKYYSLEYSSATRVTGFDVNFNDKQKENENLKKRIYELEREISSVHELKNKISLLLNENERLNALLKDKAQRVQEFEASSNPAISEIKLKLTRAGNEIQRLNSIITAKDKELQEISTKGRKGSRAEAASNNSTEEIEELKARIEELEESNSLIPELKLKFKQLYSQNKKFYLAIKDQIQIIKAWEDKYLALEELYNNIKKTVEQVDVNKNTYHINQDPYQISPMASRENGTSSSWRYENRNLF